MYRCCEKLYANWRHILEPIAAAVGPPVLVWLGLFPLSVLPSLWLAFCALIGLLRYQDWLSREKEVRRAEAAVECYFSLPAYAKILDRLTSTDNATWSGMEFVNANRASQGKAADSEPCQYTEEKFREITEPFHLEVEKYRLSLPRARIYLARNGDSEVLDSLERLSKDFDDLKVLYCGKSGGGQVPQSRDHLNPEKRKQKVEQILEQLRDIASLNRG